MKKLFPLLLTAVAFTITACHSSIPENTTSSETSTKTDAIVTTTATEQTSVVISETDLSALELLGDYTVDDRGSIIINIFSYEKECTFQNYREYFFGVWEGKIWPYTNEYITIIDDSEESNFVLHGSFFWVSDDVIAGISIGFANNGFYWINTNEPDKMYCEPFYALSDGSFGLDSYKWSDDANYEINYLTKTNVSVNQPENGYLSSLRLRELANEYDIEWETLTYIDDFNEYNLWRDERSENYPIYLISESPDKLVLKSQLGQWVYGEEKVDIIYTIELVNGEWVRTVEIDQEQLERVRERS